MNVMKQVLLLLMLTATFISCKKDEDPELTGKWNLDNIVIKEYVNNTLTNTDTQPGAGETIDFQANGNVVLTEPGMPSDTFTYTINGNTVTFDGDTYEIRNLEDNTVTLYYRQDWAVGEYDEVFINLRR
jgi:hypothetical protein